MARSTSPPPISSSHRKIRHDSSPERHRHHHHHHQHQQQYQQHNVQKHQNYQNSRSHHNQNFHHQRHFPQHHQYRHHRTYSPSSRNGPSDSRNTRPSSKYSHRDGLSSSSSRHLHRRSSSSNDLRLSNSSVTISKQHQSHRKSPSLSSGCVKLAQTSRNSAERRSATEHEDPENSCTSNAHGRCQTPGEDESLSVVSKSASGDAVPAPRDTASLSASTSSYGLTTTGLQESVDLINKEHVWQLACAMAHAYLYRDLSFDRSSLDLNLTLNLSHSQDPVAMDLNLEPNEGLEPEPEPMDVSFTVPMPSLEAIIENERNTDDEGEIDLNISLATVPNAPVSVSGAFVPSSPSGNGHVSAGTNIYCSNFRVTADEEKCPLNVSTRCTVPSLTTTTTTTTREQPEEEIVCIDEVVNPTQAAEWFGMHFSCAAALVS